MPRAFSSICSVYIDRHIRVDLSNDEQYVRNMPCYIVIWLGKFWYFGKLVSEERWSLTRGSHNRRFDCIGRKFHFECKNIQNAAYALEYFRFRILYQHQWVYKGSQSLKYANVTIPAKGQRIWVLADMPDDNPYILRWRWLELFSSSKRIASNWAVFIYRLRATQTVCNWSIKTLSPGALLRFFDFSSREYFSRLFRLFPTPTNCSWVS